MVNWYDITGIAFLFFSVVAAFFLQEELMLSFGIIALYCAVRQFKVVVNNTFGKGNIEEEKVNG